MSKRKPIFSFANLDTVTHDDPLQLFFSGIKSQETKTVYSKLLQLSCPKSLLYYK